MSFRRRRLDSAPLKRPRRLVRELRLLRRAFENWLVVGITGALWKFVPLPPRELRVKSRRGAALVVPLARDAGALYTTLEVFAFLEYDAPWQLEERPHVIDVGANVGAFTVWLAEQYPGITGACFEPNPDAYSYLLRNVDDLAVVPRPQAVAAETVQATLVRPAPSAGTSSLLGSPGAGGSAITVPVVAFDELMADVQQPVSLLKLDCEGSEYDIVLRSSRESWQNVRRIVMEYHPVNGHAPDELLAKLRETGFALMQERRVAPSFGIFWLSKGDDDEA